MHDAIPRNSSLHIKCPGIAARALVAGLAGAVFALTGCATEFDAGDPVNERAINHASIEQARWVATFEERLATALAMSTQADNAAKADAMLALIDHADDYSEAAMLVQVAGGSRATERPSEVPRELSSDPYDPDFVFEGYQMILPATVSAALNALREVRDARLDAMDSTAFEAHFEASELAHRTRRQSLAAALGRELDDRDDLYVAVLNNGQIWRRKMPAGYQPSANLGGEPGGGVLQMRSSVAVATEEQEEFARIEDTTAGAVADTPADMGVLEAVLGSDGRELRSAYNNYLMGSSVWQPKGALIRDTSDPDAVPLNVNCSGTKIAARLVATAGHCLFKNGSWNNNKRFVMGADGINASLNGGDPSPFGHRSSWVRIVRGPWYDHEWSNYDFGLFVLYDNSKSCIHYWHGWKNESNLLNDYIHIYGYPDEPLSCDASPRGDDKCYASIYGMGGNIKYAGAYRIRYTIDTQPGQSGSGVYKIINNKRYVVAVHRGQWSSTRNDGVHINNGNANMINDAVGDYPATACN